LEEGLPTKPPQKIFQTPENLSGGRFKKFRNGKGFLGRKLSLETWLPFPTKSGEEKNKIIPKNPQPMEEIIWFKPE